MPPSIPWVAGVYPWVANPSPQRVPNMATPPRVQVSFCAITRILLRVESELLGKISVQAVLVI